MSIAIDIDDVGGLSCVWGALTNPAPDLNPEREPEHLVLVTAVVLETALTGATKIAPGGGRVDARAVGDRKFVTLERGGRKWAWEVFPAHWADGTPQRLYIGRWPD